MFVGREEETAAATQIASIGHIIDGTADIQTGYLSVTFMPCLVQ
jgi:hypothetical protein